MTETTHRFPYDLQPHACQISGSPELREINNAFTAAIAALQAAAPVPLNGQVGDALFNHTLLIEFTARSGEGLVAVVRLPSGMVCLPAPRVA